MGQDAALPPGLFERIRQMIADELGKLLRSGLLRNASISDGGLTIKGGFLKLLDKISGTTLFYVGPVNPPRADGTPQQGWYVYRADGTIVLLLRDTFPTDSGGALNQALTWFDRKGNVVVSDDTDSGEGHARPWIPLPIPQTTSIASWPSTTATAWGNIAESFGIFQQPKVYWNATAVADAGTTAQVRLSIHGGATVGPVHTVTGGTTAFINDLITLPAGFYGQGWAIDVQAQVTAGTGKVSCQTWELYGRQT